MKKGHALLVSAGLAGLAMAGAGAAMHSATLGLAAPKRATAAASAIAAQQAKLDRWSAALARARRAHPPALPAVPRFPAVRVPAALVASRQLASAPAPVAAPQARSVAAVPVQTPKRGGSTDSPPVPVTTAVTSTAPEPETDPAATDPAVTEPTTTQEAPPPATVVVTVPAPPTTTGERSDDGHGDDGHDDGGGDHGGDGGDD